MRPRTLLSIGSAFLVLGLSPNAVANDSQTIRARSGEVFTVPAFTQGHKPIVAGTRIYYDLSHEGPNFGNETDIFDVQYGVDGSYFNVTLLAPPLGVARRAAEKFLRSKLHLSNSQLCKLNITVGTPNGVDRRYARYSNLGLSFCPGAVRLR